MYYSKFTLRKKKACTHNKIDFKSTAAATRIKKKKYENKTKSHCLYQTKQTVWQANLAYNSLTRSSKQYSATCSNIIIAMSPISIYFSSDPL